MTDNRTTELLQVGDILLNEPVNERIVVVDADAVSVWLRKVENNDELMIYDGNVWAKLGIKHGNKNRCSQHYAQTVFEFDGYVQQGIAATVGSGEPMEKRVLLLEKLLDRWYSFAVGNGLDQSCADYEEWCALERATLEQLER